MSKIIILDDEYHIRKDLEFFLQKEGYDVYTSATIENMQALILNDIDCAIIDLNLNDNSPVGGLEIYLHFLRNKPNVNTLILSAYPFESIEKLLAGHLRGTDYEKQIVKIMAQIKRDYIYKGEKNYIDAVVSKLAYIFRQDGAKTVTPNDTPDQKKHHATKIYNMHIEGNVGSLSTGSVDIKHKSKLEIKNDAYPGELKSFLETIINKIDDIPIDKSAYKEANEYINIIQTQSNKTNPNKTLLHESLTSIRVIMEGIASNTAATGLIKLINNLL